MTQKFRALVVDQVAGQTVSTVRELGLDDLPEGDVTVAVRYSSLNYKDGLAVTGQARVLRSHPLVPGIDLAGTVIESGSSNIEVGDNVLVTGYEIGEKYWGGYTQLTRVRSEWLVPVPTGLSLKQVMTIGTAGLTAMLSVMALEEQGLQPEDQREIVVTGAAGGVGSMAVAILGNLGYNVVASTGRPDVRAYLQMLGARDVIDRAVLGTPSKRPLEAERWAGAVDAVGGDSLAGLLRMMAPVLPFILRGVKLLGIDSNFCPHVSRLQAWERLARLMSAETLDRIGQEASLDDVSVLSKEILQGKVRGRIVVVVTPDGA
jgi:acrylyl-CoA reductase (NADPH)